MTNERSSLVKISIVIPDLKSHYMIMSARVYSIKTVNGCKDVSLTLQCLRKMNSEDGQVYSVCIL